MAKLTFADVLGKPFTAYYVSRGGSIAIYEGVRLCKRKRIRFHSDTWSEEYYLDKGGLMSFDVSEVHKTAVGLNENGNIHIGWSYGIFLNKEDAQALALKIAKTKYDNSVKKIMNI